MKINTRLFAITLRASRLYVRLGSHEHGLELKVAHVGSYLRWNWKSASWRLA